MAYNAALDSACRFSEEKPINSGASAGSGIVGTNPNQTEMSAIWSGVYLDIKGRLAAVGLTVSGAVPAKTVVAQVEAKFTSAEFIQRSVSNNNEQEIPEATLLRAEASAMLQRYLDNPTILSALSAVRDTTFRMAGGYFFGVSATAKDATEFDDITMYRDSEF